LTTRTPRTVAAGERPSRGGRRSGRGRLLAALLAAAAVVALAGPLRQPVVAGATGAWDWLRTRLLPRIDEVTPIAADAAQPALPEHGPELAIDRNRATWWAEAAPGAGAGSALTVDFGQPVDLAAVIVTAGAAGEEWVRQPRPATVRLTFPDGTSVPLELANTPEPQPFGVDARQVTGVTLTVDSIHPAQGGEALAIAELEFRAHR